MYTYTRSSFIHQATLSTSFLFPLSHSEEVEKNRSRTHGYRIFSWILFVITTLPFPIYIIPLFSPWFLSLLSLLPVRPQPRRCLGGSIRTRVRRLVPVLHFPTREISTFETRMHHRWIGYGVARCADAHTERSFDRVN